jgi:CheY-like chemotaxis protein
MSESSSLSVLIKTASPEEKVFIIAAEDEAINQRLLQRAFNHKTNPEAQKYTLLIVGNGEEAKNALTGHSFKTIDDESCGPITSAAKIICLMDRNMPVLGGDIATQVIKCEHRRNSLPGLSDRIAIVAYSTQVTDLLDSQQTTAGIGYDAVWKKPLPPKELLAKIEEIANIGLRKASCPACL